MSYPQEFRTQALDAYMHSHDTAHVIAANFGVSPSSLTVWAKDEGIPLRERGRNKAETPSEDALNRLQLLANGLTQEEVGAKTGVSKQRVSRIAKRWPHVLAELKCEHHQPTIGKQAPAEKLIPGHRPAAPVAQMNTPTPIDINMKTESEARPTSAPDQMPANQDKSALQEVPIVKIDVSRAIQTRHGVNKEKIADYAERMQAGDEFPPAQHVQFDGVYFLVDGIHRRVAAEQAGKSTLLCSVTPGTREGAVRAAMKANTTHGLPRSNKDKKFAALVALKELPDLSSRAIADLLKVAHSFIEDVRRELESESSPSTKKRTGRDGRKRKAPSHSESNSADASSPPGENEGQEGDTTASHSTARFLPLPRKLPSRWQVDRLMTRAACGGCTHFTTASILLRDVTEAFARATTVTILHRVLDGWASASTTSSSNMAA
jgi:ParB-like chromosome segregation protein Spo0J